MLDAFLIHLTEVNDRIHQTEDARKGYIALFITIARSEAKVFIEKHLS